MRLLASARSNAQPKHTVPTGFSGVPPPGPAMPVIEMAAVTPLLSCAPKTIALATASLTAPSDSINIGDTCKHAVAVFYKLRAKDFTDSAEKLKELLANLHNDALRVFVKNLLKKDRKFRNEFLREFDEDFEEDEFEDEFDEDYY